MTGPATSKQNPLGVLGFGAAVCAACCAGPLLAFLGGATIAGLAGTVFLGVACLVVAVIAGVAFGVVRRRRQRLLCTAEAETRPIGVTVHPGKRVPVESEGVR